MARSYYNLFGLRSTGLRFFTVVYGPWGRPDMAYYIFTKKMFNKKIEVFNFGNNSRDFTYIDDIVKELNLLLKKIMIVKFLTLVIILTVKLMEMIKIIENKLNLKAKVTLKPMAMGDVS